MRRALNIIAGSSRDHRDRRVSASGSSPGRAIGHERVRQFALGVLKSHVHGKLSIGRIDGNLLTGTTIHDISITDSTRRPFLVADAVKARYSGRSR